jgi:hypothetical protein
VEARLNRDPEWRAEADALQKAWEMLDQLPRAAPSSSFTNQTLTKISALRPAASTTLSLPTAGRRFPWTMTFVALAGVMLGWALTHSLLRNRDRFVPWNDPGLVRDLRLIDNLPFYGAVESLEFLQMLDHPDRFGADSLGP